MASDTALNTIIQWGTTAERGAFVPNPAPGSQILYLWFDTDDLILYVWQDPSWVGVNSPGGAAIYELTGDVTAGPGVGTQVATIANSAVTYAKMQDVSLASKLLGRGAAGGNAVREINLGTGLAMVGDTLNSSGSGITELTGDGTAGPGSGSQVLTIPALSTLGSAISTLGSAITALVNAAVLTDGDETVTFPNSRELLAGTNVSFDDTTPGERTINASPGAGGIDQLTGDVTAGPGTGSQAATIANNAVTTAKIADDNVTYAKIQNVTTDRLLGRDTAGSGDVEEVSLSTGLEFSGSTSIRMTTNQRTRSIIFIIDGGGSTITTGVKGDIGPLPFNGTITKATLLADQSGSIVVDIWKDTYANYPPTVADTITASAPPTITTAVKSQDTTLTGWTTSFSSGDTLRYNVNSVTTITRVTVTLEVTVS